MATSMTVLLLWCLLQGVAGQSWTVFMPDSVMGLEGSCVRIPCRFTVGQGWHEYLDSSCKAQWTTGWEKRIVFDSSHNGDLNLLQGKLEGDLTKTDCTTVFHNITTSESKYSFRLTCSSNRLHYNYNPGVAITVKDEWKPSLSPGNNVEVQEGGPVMLSCTAQIICPLQPPTLSWRPSLGDTQEKVGATSVTSVLTFNASSIHHGQRIFCSSLYKRQGGHRNVSFEKRLTLNVFYPPTNVSVEWPSWPVQKGSYVRLSCKGSANPPASYNWYRSRLHPGTDQRPNQGSLGFDQSIYVSVSEDTQFYCELRNRYGMKNSSMTQMEVRYPPTNVSVEWPSRPVQKGSYVRLSCKGSANPPARYYWYRSRLHPGTDQGPLGFDQSINVSVSEDTQFYCELRNRYGTKNSSMTQMEVHFPPKEVELRVEAPDGLQEGLGFTLSCSCWARPPASNYTWYWVSGRDHVPLLGHGANLTVERAERRHGGRYYCLAGNYLGAKMSAMVHLDIHFAAEILNSSHCWRLPSGVHCYCESQGNPMPSLAWKLAGEAVNHSAHCEIREYKKGDMGIISVISLAQSDEDPPTLVCHSNNSVDVDHMELNLAFSEIDQPALHTISLLIGWTVGCVVMMLLCTVFHVTLCGNKTTMKKKEGQQSEESKHRSSPEIALAPVEQEEVVYTNKAALYEGGKEEELHYVDVSFVMLTQATNPEVDFIRGMDSKTAEYAQIQPHHAERVEGEPPEEEVYAECVSFGQAGAREEVMAEGPVTDAKDFGIAP